MSMDLTRRGFALGGAALALAGACAPPDPASTRPVRLILAPCSLGLRPKADGSEPGAWRAPAALLEAGLPARLHASETIDLARPTYRHDAQAGTRIRNGQTLRRFLLALGDRVNEAIGADRFPLVVGGDCSVLLGCLHGARRAGGRGLVHVDGHSDFDANYDSFYGDIVRTGITRLIIQEVQRIGIDETVRRTLAHMESRGIDRAWLHVDLDVLDAAVMPAVDSPGSPGFDFGQLGALLAGLKRSGRFLGAAVAICDPELDPDGRHGRSIVAMLGEAFGGAA